jgi:hypothetical protein
MCIVEQQDISYSVMCLYSLPSLNDADVCEVDTRIACAGFALTKKKDSVLVELLVHGIVKEGPSPTNFCELSFHRL